MALQSVCGSHLYSNHSLNKIGNTKSSLRSPFSSLTVSAASISRDENSGNDTGWRIRRFRTGDALKCGHIFVQPVQSICYSPICNEQCIGNLPHWKILLHVLGRFCEAVWLNCPCQAIKVFYSFDAGEYWDVAFTNGAWQMNNWGVIERSWIPPTVAGQL